MRTCVRETVWMVVVVGLVAVLSPVQCSGEVWLRQVGAFPFGPVEAVARTGSLAVYGSGAALVVADVSDPELPRVLGSAPLPGTVEEIAIEGDRAVVSVYRAGLHVVDVSDAGAPTEVGSFEPEPGDTLRDVAVAGGLAFVWDHPDLLVLDLSLGGDPVVVGRLPMTRRPVDIAAEGPTVVAASDEEGAESLWLIDVSRPSAPAVVATVAVPVDSRSTLKLSAGRAYLTEWNGLHVVDVLGPSAPVEIGFLEMDRPEGVAVSGFYAYVLAGGLQVVNVMSPESPLVVGSSEAWGSAVAVSGPAAVVAHSREGLRVIDVSVPASPEETAILEAPGWATQVAVDGDLAYVASRYEGLRVFDVSSPSEPTPVGLAHLFFPGGSGADDSRVNDVAVSGSHVYLRVSSYLLVVDVSSPAAPVQVGSCVVVPPDASGGNGTGVAVAGGYAYVAVGDSGLNVIDVSDPTDPHEEGFVELEGGASGVAIQGDLAYVGGVGLHVLDLSTPSAPFLVGTSDYVCDYWLCGHYAPVAVSGDVALVTQPFHGLRVLDVSVPTAPIELAMLEGELFVDVAVSGSRAHLLDDNGVLSVVDFSEPGAPVEVGATSTAERGNGLAVADGLVYLANRRAGLSIYCPGPCLSPDRAMSWTR